MRPMFAAFALALLSTALALPAHAGKSKPAPAAASVKAETPALDSFSEVEKLRLMVAEQALAIEAQSVELARLKSIVVKFDPVSAAEKRHKDAIEAFYKEHHIGEGDSVDWKTMTITRAEKPKPAPAPQAEKPANPPPKPEDKKAEAAKAPAPKVAEKTLPAN